MQIRTVQPGDLARILEINNSESKWVGQEELSFFQQYIGIAAFNVAHNNSDILGFLMAMDEKTKYDESKNFLWFCDRIPRFLYVDRVVVDSTMRNQGIGGALYQELIAKRHGWPIVCEVAIDPPNPGSVRFHERFGFRGMGEFSADGKKMCRMYKLD